MRQTHLRTANSGYLLYLASIKLFIKITIERLDVPIIIKTLSSPIPPSSIDFGSLVPIREINISKVNKIATCEKILFNFSFLLDSTKHIKIKTPKAVGINAVGEETSINPHKPIIIRAIEFMTLVVFGFIIYLYLSFYVT